MDTIDCIKTRRSIRKYKDEKVSEKDIDEIIEAGMYAPSAHNRQPWAFVVVREEEKLEKLSKVHQWAPFVKNADVCIVICCTDRGENKSAMHLSVACAVQNMLLAVHHKKLGSCWTYVHNLENNDVEENVKEILEIQEDTDVICMLPIGYPDQTRNEKELKSPKDIVHFEKWGSSA